jgi:hypothetical protein
LDTQNWNINGATLSLADSVASVTDGTLFATFGLAPNTDDFSQYGVSIAGRVAASGLTNLFNAAGGTFLPDDYLNNGKEHDLVSIANILDNAAFLAGESPWQFASSDPFFFRVAVPEPSTLALWGCCLAIGALIAARRRRG